MSSMAKGLQIAITAAGPRACGKTLILQELRDYLETRGFAVTETISWQTEERTTAYKVTANWTGA